MITLLILFQIKHFICDFPLQKPYQYLNKGIYGHLGGILHSITHGCFTAVILSLFTTEVIAIAVFEALIHYHIDWAKVKINKHYSWKCDNSEKFWWLLGFDQLLHQLTYLGIVWLLTK